MSSESVLLRKLNLLVLVPLLLRGSSALNSENKLVQVWDSIEFYSNDTNEFQGQWNFTSFPYIDGVSLPTLLTLSTVQAKPDRNRIRLLHTQRHLLQRHLQLDASRRNLDFTEPF